MKAQSRPRDGVIVAHTARRVSLPSGAGGIATDCRCGRPGYGAVQRRLRHGRARCAVGMRVCAADGNAGGGLSGGAPSASAMCRQAWRSGVAVGRCRTTRRTEPTTCAPNLRSRSRSHVTWARAQAVRAARSRSSCISTCGGGEEHAQLIGPKRQQLVRSICRPSSNSLIRFSMSPRAQ